jgi:hypothetical protein
MLYAKFEKCDFYQRKIKYIGHVISEDGIEVDPESVKANMEWYLSKNVA